MKALFILLSLLLPAAVTMGQVDEGWIKEAAVERLMKYVRIDTQSKEDAGQVPSTRKQFDLARVLLKELRELGLPDAKLDEEHCYVYATLPSNLSAEETARIPVIGFIAHVDASPSVSDAGVNPILHRNYQGGDIVLPNDTTQVITVEKNRNLLNNIGGDIITTDGTTLLAADDKAGIAEIMTAVEYMLKHPEVKHGTLKIAFTPDEEVGHGPRYFDIKGFGAKYAYTVDGGQRGEFSDETFNAQVAVVIFNGKNTHPGYAKGILVNSLYAASHFISLFPEDMKPETTEGRQGYLHPYDLAGNEESTRLKVLIRDFDTSGMKEKSKILEDMKQQTLKEFPRVKIDLVITDTYRNMNSVLSKYPDIVNFAQEAMEKAGVKPIKLPVRGGTDGSQLTFMGMPTANIFAGEENPHGKLEWIPALSMVKSVETIMNISTIWAEKGMAE
ncbi:MAG TPA: peptidase T [Candidatus Kryptobacter bacterium]|nr:peptidase T [Candidatus Kryptobacter bacterium]